MLCEWPLNLIFEQAIGISKKQKDLKILSKEFTIANL